MTSVMVSRAGTPEVEGPGSMTSVMVSGAGTPEVEGPGSVTIVAGAVELQFYGEWFGLGRNAKHGIEFDCK